MRYCEKVHLIWLYVQFIKIIDCHFPIFEADLSITTTIGFLKQENTVIKLFLHSVRKNLQIQCFLAI